MTANTHATNMSVGERIRQAREALGLEVEELAQRVGVTQETLQEWETDDGDLRPNRLNTLAGVLNVPIQWLITGEEPEAVYPCAAADSVTRHVSAKVERAIAMQQELSALLQEVTDDLERLERQMGGRSAAA